MKLLVESSFCSGSDMTQAGLTFLLSEMSNLSIDWKLHDNSGVIDYYSPPDLLYSSCKDENWGTCKAIIEADWIDDFIKPIEEDPDVVVFSSLFSPDLIFHARQSFLLKQRLPDVKTIIGGSALSALNYRQITELNKLIDVICIGHDIGMLQRALNSKERQIISSNCAPIIKPNYDLIDIRSLVTVFSGSGCYWGKCRFCGYSSYAKNIYIRNPEDTVNDIMRIGDINPEVDDIVLTLDAYPRKIILDTANLLISCYNEFPYCIMCRVERWIDDYISEILARSGCSGVFLGCEALDDQILSVINKGITSQNIISCIKTLSKYVDVDIGLILFIPGVTRKQLNRQRINIEKIINNIRSIQPEILTVVQGSRYAIESQKFGIYLYEASVPLNDSWCFGFSPDIPWTIQEKDKIDLWLGYIRWLFEIGAQKIDPIYHRAVNDLVERLS